MTYPLRFLSISFLQILLSVLIAFAQEPRFTNYTIEQGLPNNEVYHVMQDSKGFLWFCTDRGVSKYDGSNFINYTTEDGLLNNTVYLSYEDDNGRIWFLSNSAKLCYYNGNRIVEFRFNSSIDSLKLGNSPKVSIITSGEEVYVGTNSSGYYHVTASGKAELKTEANALSVLNTPNGPLIYRFLSKSKVPDSLLKVILDDSTYYFPRKISVISRLLPTKKGFYFSDGSNLFRYDNHELKLLLTSKRLITSIFKDTENGLWLGKLDGGVCLYEVVDDTLVLKRNYLKDESVSWICEDFEKGMWFSTLKSGLFFWPSNSGTSLFAEENLPRLSVKGIQLITDSAAFISYSNGNIWRAEFRSEPSLVDSSRYFSRNENQPLYKYSDNRLISPNFVLKLFEKESLKIIDSMKRILGIDTLYHQWRSPVLKCFIADSSDHLWVGTGDGLFKFYNNEIERIYVHPLKNQLETRENFNIDALYLLHDTLYFSTIDGVYKLVNNHFYYLGDAFAALKNRVEVISSVGNSTLLFGSRGNGLYVLRKDSLFKIDEDKGLEGSFINDINVSENNEILVGTNKGLFLLTLDGGISLKQRFGESQGLKSNYVTKIARQGDYIWVGSLSGLTVINLGLHQKNLIPPIVSVDSIIIEGVARAVYKNITLTHRENNIKFLLTGISFQSRGELDFSYRMEGLDTTWRVTENREITFYSLPPGNYKLELYATNKAGIKSETRLLLINIQPPFWQQLWFIVISIISILSIIVVLIKRRDNRIKERSSFQKRTLELELKALRSQMNPHFTFNTLSSIQQFILENDALKANDYLSRFAALIRKVLENSRHKFISLKEEIETLEIYLELEQLRFSGSFDYKISLDGSIETDRILIPPAIIQPFVENSIIHGLSHKEGKGMILINFKKVKDTIECQIVDDGVGRKTAGEIEYKRGKKEGALGMDITRERLQLMEKSENSEYYFEMHDILNEKEGVSGTLIRLVFPYKNNQ